jgi:hypothetical protein
MATITAASVVNRAGILLQDQTGVRWPKDELLGWLNDGQREIVLIRPDACSTNEAMALVGGTKQTIPAAGTRLLDITRNMGSDSSTPGRAVRLVDREILDAQVPDWHTAAPAATVLHWLYDERDPKTFYVYPAQPATGQGSLEILYASSPANATIDGVDSSSTDSPISIDDVYANALMDYIMYRAFSKNTEYTRSGQAQGYYTTFRNSLGLKTKVDRRMAPEEEVAPGLTPERR